MMHRHGLQPKPAGAAQVLTLVPYTPPKFETKIVKQVPKPVAVPSFTKVRYTSHGYKGGGNSRPHPVRQTLIASAPARLMALPNTPSVPTESPIAAAPTVNPQPKSTPDVTVVANESPLASPTAPVQSTSTSTEIVATAPEIGLTSGDISGPVVANTGVASGIDGLANSGTGINSSGTGNSGNGNSNGTGTAGTGNGAGSSDGSGNGTGNNPGDGDNAGEYTAGGSGLPFGLNGGAGNSDPKHIVYVLDASPSMAAKIKTASAEVASAMKQLVPGDSFDIIMFGDDVTKFRPGMVAFTTELIASAQKFMDIPANEKGGTNLEEAVSTALNIGGTTEIVVVTDGVPTEGEIGAYKLAHIIQQRNFKHVRVYTIGLMDTMLDDPEDTSAATRLLHMLADANGGASRMLDVAKW